MRACGYEQCQVRMSKDGNTLLFGWGKVMFDGTWQYPCVLCIAHHIEEEKAQNEDAVKPNGV